MEHHRFPLFADPEGCWVRVPLDLLRRFELNVLTTMARPLRGTSSAAGYRGEGAGDLSFMTDTHAFLEANSVPVSAWDSCCAAFAAEGDVASCFPLPPATSWSVVRSALPYSADMVQGGFKNAVIVLSEIGAPASAAGLGDQAGQVVAVNGGGKDAHLSVLLGDTVFALPVFSDDRPRIDALYHSKRPMAAAKPPAQRTRPGF